MAKAHRKNTRKANRKNMRRTRRANRRNSRRNMRGGFQAEAAGTNAMAYKSPFVTNTVKY